MFWNWFLPSEACYRRRQPLVLINGLAEQPETWFRNLAAWRKQFDVHTPALLAYDGPVIQRRIAAHESIDVPFLVERLRTYIDEFIQGPVHLLANSMGGKIAVEFAIRHPELVRRLVLLCPSGLAEEERLPIVEGVRRSDLGSMIDSVFYDQREVDARLLDYYHARFRDKRWRMGLLRTIRGTMEHSVRHRMNMVTQPTLLVVGEEDRIVDPQQSLAAGQNLPHGTIVRLPKCGHAPQIERAGLVNRLVTRFLTGTT